MTEQERGRLLEEKAKVAAEIRTYPFPIPACDAQFNWLLQRRAEIEQALAYGAQTASGT
jgi:hypothetical protein